MRRWVAAGLIAAGGMAATACVPKPGTVEPQPQAVRPIILPAAAPVPSGPSTFLFQGEMEQGGWIRGQVPARTRAARLGNQALTLDKEGRFFAGFDRDAATQATLVAELDDGRIIESPLTIRPRNWQIEHVNVARRPGGTSEDFLRRRAPELARINAAREVRSASEGWRQSFIWPATGRISGRFGAQRIYRGEPGSYHSGLDIAGGAGTPFVAPADGVVVLAANEELSLEGKLLIIDHGMGLNSAFLHADSLAVKEGQAVRQGQLLGTIGASGRARGPHLHWGLKWEDARLDPLLFLPPMP